MNKWTENESQTLVYCIETNGLSAGIKEFRESYPERSYNACYSKYNRIIAENEEIEANLDYDATTPVNEVNEEVKSYSFWQRIKNFFKNLFNG